MWLWRWAAGSTSQPLPSSSRPTTLMAAAKLLLFLEQQGDVISGKGLGYLKSNGMSLYDHPQNAHTDWSFNK